MLCLDPQNVLYLVPTVNPKIADDVDIFFLNPNYFLERVLKLPGKLNQWPANSIPKAFEKASGNRDAINLWFLRFVFSPFLFLTYISLKINILVIIWSSQNTQIGEINAVLKIGTFVP